MKKISRKNELRFKSSMIERVKIHHDDCVCWRVEPGVGATVGLPDLILLQRGKIPAFIECKLVEGHEFDEMEEPAFIRLLRPQQVSRMSELLIRGYDYFLAVGSAGHAYTMFWLLRYFPVGESVDSFDVAIARAELPKTLVDMLNSLRESQ